MRSILPPFSFLLSMDLLFLCPCLCLAILIRSRFFASRASVGSLLVVVKIGDCCGRSGKDPPGISFTADKIQRPQINREPHLTNCSHPSAKYTNPKYTIHLIETWVRTYY